MALKAKLLGRADLTRKLNAVEPKILEAAAKAKLEIAEQAAEAIQQKAIANFGAGDYSRSIVGERQDANPNKKAFGHKESQDPDATGVYAKYIWRWLEYGTKPHYTTKGGGTKAGSAKASAGGTGMHPGTRARPHIFPTWRAMKKKARSKMLRAINKAVKETMRK